jgi:hypothetical protein
MKLHRDQLDCLIAMFPEGADVLEGRRRGHLHAEPLGDAERYESGAKMRGVLIVHEGLRPDAWGHRGCASLGISRETYFTLPEGGLDMDNPNPKDQAAYEKATKKLATEVPKLVSALWRAGADQGDVETQLLDAARAMILQESQTEEPKAATPK